MTNDEKLYNQNYTFIDDYVTLKIRAEDAEDIQVISTLLQDSLVPSKSLLYDPAAKTLSFLANRFRWEASAKNDTLEQNERVFASVFIENVTSFEKIHFSESKDETHHSLLCIMPQSNQLILKFSGNAELIVTTPKIKVRVRDVSDPWPTEVCPLHPDSAAKT